MMSSASRPKTTSLILCCLVIACTLSLCKAKAQGANAHNYSALLAFDSPGKAAASNSVIERGGDNAATSGEECRDPHGDEAAVIENAKKVIEKCISERLRQIGWQAKNSSSIPPSIATHPNPYRPMFICSSVFDLVISPDPNSAYGKMINDSIRYYSRQSDQRSILRMVLLGALQNIKIRIAENNPYLKEPFAHDPTDKYTILQVPGTAYAYRLTLPGQGEQADMPPDYKTFVYLGPWAGVDMNAATYVKYPFVHKVGGAYIETFTIQIIGPASVADKVIQSVDWQGLNSAFTK